MKKLLFIVFALLVASDALAQGGASIALGKTYTSKFLMTFSATGTEIAADATPTCSLYEETTASPLSISGNMTLMSGTTNVYYIQYVMSTANGAEAGKYYNNVCTATVGGLTQNITNDHFKVTATEGTTGYDPIDITALTELAQAAPSATPSLQAAIMALYMALRNQVLVTNTLKSFTNDAGTVIYKKTLSDNGTTFTEAEAVSGP